MRMRLCSLRRRIHGGLRERLCLRQVVGNAARIRVIHAQVNIRGSQVQSFLKQWPAFPEVTYIGTVRREAVQSVCQEQPVLQRRVLQLPSRLKILRGIIVLLQIALGSRCGTRILRVAGSEYKQE